MRITWAPICVGGQTGHFSRAGPRPRASKCSSTGPGSQWALPGLWLPLYSTKRDPGRPSGGGEGWRREPPSCCCLSQRLPPEWNPWQKWGGSWIKGSGQDEELLGKVLLPISPPLRGRPLLERGQGLKNTFMQGDTRVRTPNLAS